MKAKFKKVLSLALALTMVLTLAACGGNNAGNTSNTGNTGNTTNEQTGGETAAEGETLAAEQVFYFFLNNEPGTLDPWVNNSAEASQIVIELHEPMLRRDGEGGWLPGLMTDYQTNEDHTVHTLTLREGAKWSDGTDITVDDIVYSYQRALDPALGSSIAYRYFPILNAEAFYMGEVGADELGVKAVDDHTIEITTTEPCDYFVDMMTSAGFAPVQKAAADPARSKQIVQFSYSMRMLGMVVVLILGFTVPWLHWLAVLLPQLFPRVTIGAMQAMGMYKPAPAPSEGGEE